jgi:hypothetical protein
VPRIVEWMRALAEQDLGQVWVLVRDHQPAGYMVITFGYSLEFGGRDAFIDELFVEPSAPSTSIAAGDSSTTTAI